MSAWKKLLSQLTNHTQVNEELAGFMLGSYEEFLTQMGEPHPKTLDQLYLIAMNINREFLASSMRGESLDECDMEAMAFNAEIAMASKIAIMKMAQSN